MQLKAINIDAVIARYHHCAAILWSDVIALRQNNFESMGRPKFTQGEEDSTYTLELQTTFCRALRDVTVWKRMICAMIHGRKRSDVGRVSIGGSV